MDSHPSAHNLAARMARWSSKHRKAAFWGWLAFVILAFGIGNAVGPNNISDVDNFNGESHRAEQTLDRAGLRPQSEVVFIQSDKLTIKDPQFRAAVQDVTTHLRKVPYVQNVQSPLAGESAVSENGHAALVDFDVAGDSTEAKDRIDAVLAATAAAQKRHPALAVEGFGDASANKAINEVIGDDLKKAGELSLPVTLILLLITFGTLVAAGVPLWIGLSAVIATLGLVNIPSQILPIDNNLPAVILLIGLAVGRGLLAVLPQAGAGGACRWPEPGGGARGGRGDVGSRRADLRRDRDGRDGRHVHQRRQDVHLVRDGDDPRRRRGGIRVAHGSSGDAQLARGPS